MDAIRFLNVSQVQGGQERYLDLLRSGLAASPRRSGAEQPRAMVINGNRALYHFALHPPVFRTCVYVQHSHILDNQAGRLRPRIRSLLMRAALSRIDGVIRVCDAVFPEALAPGRVYTVHNGVDVREFPCREVWRRDARTPINLIMVGALTRNKNQRLALDVLARLTDARLVLLGQGPERPALEQAGIELGLAERVTWAGQQERPAPYYRAADLCLMLSDHEGLPFAVLEAMASGTPVVSFPVGGVPEVIEDGIDGVLVRERTAEAVASAISVLAADPERLRRMGLAARAKIEARFTQAHMVEGFLRVVEETRRRKGGSCA